MDIAIVRQLTETNGENHLRKLVFYKPPSGENVCISNISQYEKIDLPDATFNMFLPQHVKSANDFAGKSHSS